MHLSERLLDASNGGYDIIYELLDGKAQQLAQRGKTFCFGPNDRNPSCGLKKNKDGVWFLHDFGGDIKGGNAISVYAEYYGLDWTEALLKLASKYGLLDGGKSDTWGKAEYKSPIPTKNQKAGDYTIVKRDFKDDDWSTLFSRHVLEFCKANIDKDKHGKNLAWHHRLIELCKLYNFVALKEYTFCSLKDDKLVCHQFVATDDYPIYAYDMGTWCKIYQPFARDKKFRFMHLGQKPETFMFGLEQFRDKYKNLEASNNANADNAFDSDGNEIEGTVIKKELKLSEVIYCTGGSDALNVAAFGYSVIWANSETGNELTHDVFKELGAKSYHVYNLPDLDTTGKREAHKLAMFHLDLKTIELPAALAEYSDSRGGKCKDVKDYFKHYTKSNFDVLLKMAKPYRFWDVSIKRNKEGDKIGTSYECNNVQLYNFLMKNGFYQFKANNGQTDMFIKVTGNTVKEIEPKVIRQFVNGFLEERSMPVELRNVFLKTTQLNSTSMENLGYTNLQFKTFGKTFQYLIYKDCVLEVTANGIQEHKPGSVDVFAWDEQVINRRMYKRLKERPFTITQENGQFNIEIHHRECLFFRFLENSCKMHWKVEKEGVEAIDANGNTYLRKEYTIEEQREHDEHLINRIFTVGYLMHSYKNPSKPWAVWVQENVVMDDNDSNGGSGKSILANCFKNVMGHLTIGARDTKVTENKFLFENVNERIKIIHMNDCHKYLDLGYFYPMLTDDLSINPKQNRQITMPFSMSPKFIFSSNYSPRDQTQSGKRRLLTTAFSDYYHEGSKEGNNLTSFSPREEFGKNLFVDFTDPEWEQFDTTMAYCLQFYLSLANTTTKIDPPQNVIRHRALLSEMVTGFYDWALTYFSEESGNININLPRQQMLEDFCSFSHSKVQMNNFTKSLKAFAELEGFEFNPPNAPRYNAKSGRIIDTYAGKSADFIHMGKKLVLEETAQQVQASPAQAALGFGTDPLNPPSEEIPM